MSEHIIRQNSDSWKLSYPAVELLIGGKWRRQATAPIDIHNPTDGSTIGVCPTASDHDLDDSLAAAALGFGTWRKTPAVDRARVLRAASHILHGNAEQIATWITAEQGKPKREALAEVLYTCDVLAWNAGEAERIYGRLIAPRIEGERLMVLRGPIGPVAAFTPWNFPIYQPAAKIAPAIAAGCSVILKPSEETPAGAWALVKAFQEAGLPDGVLNLVFGDAKHISTRLIASPIVRKVSFTGSVPVGRQIARQAADNLQKVTLELGGHAPVIVCGDVDPVVVAQHCAAQKFRNSGQVCVSASRFLVHSSIAEVFTAAFADAARSIELGSGCDSRTGMGPLTNERRLQAVASLVSEAVESGARLITGGQRVGGSGFFFEPTVLADVPPTARVMTEELFGPIAAVAKFDELSDAIRIANAVEYGLAAYAFTGQSAVAERLMNEIEAGMVLVNSFDAMYPETPFGGIKWSGYGAENGREGVEAYLHTKFAALAPPLTSPP